MKNKTKLIRITTVPISLEKLLENQLTYMSEWYDITAISADKERLQKFGKDNGVKTFHVALTRQITPFQDLKALYKLYKYLKKEKPEIVHTHTPKAGIIGMLAAKLAGVPNRLHTVAGLPLLEATGFKRKILNFVEKLTYKSATHIYPNSYGLKEIIVSQGFTEEDRLKVIANGSSNGINISHFKPKFSQKKIEKWRKEIGIREDNMVFIFVGRVVGDKGINELVAAFSELNKLKKNISLLLVGDFETKLDPLRKETLKQIETNNNIFSVGYQREVRPYFEISDILTFPSYREGLPNVVLQAGAMGLPSIVTDINGCNEIIEHEKNGLIIPVNDEKALYKAMLELFSNRQLRERLNQQARNSIVAKYQQQVVWEALKQEYMLL